MSQWGQQNQGNRPNTGFGPSNQWGAPRQPAQQWAPAPQWSPPSNRPQQWSPGQQWGAPRPQAGWAPPAGPAWTPNNAGWQATQQRPPANFGYNMGVPGGPAPRKRGSSVLKLVLFVIGGFVLAMVAFSVFSQTDDPVQNPPAEYQNEDYQVPEVDTSPPEIPMPETYSEAQEWLTTNSIYDQGVAVPVRCEATPIDLMNASQAELENHLNEFTGCLMRVFGPTLEQAGYQAVRPSVTIYTTSVNTKCGEMPMQNAAYCAADQQVYYAADLPEIVPADLQGVNYVVESVIAHEFGHAIQARTGILISEVAWEQNSDEATANNFSRRLEVQADCFAGEFIQSVGYSVGVDDTSAQELSELFYSIGDDVLTGDPNYDGNHGHGDTRQAWFMAGYQNSLLSSCNTFTVGDAEVK
ncbi:neutral zinc metallopeptidase [Propionimicrobium sp. PCR01-08-3]|uniref:neutral zinc metallopeptidase n=1 Tax=Propionimicrobium sp. PCR01-08-3 TaxID=3052086 RepID=UPI00255CA9FF|nr:neutral zinc metallopeptidase [Propionimicrobium sp. PCR01-08-3]WIY82270.1 neutral zinc metallopeptidase [Propionimicrobium sp. PCR01-08-3]